MWPKSYSRQLQFQVYQYLDQVRLIFFKKFSNIHFISFLATGIARSISPGQVIRQDSSNAMTAGSNVATIIRAHSVQQTSQPPQPPVKKGQFAVASSARVPPPIPPNKPIINKSNANIVTSTASRISFLQSQTVPGVSVAAQAIAAQNAKDGEE